MSKITIINEKIVRKENINDHFFSISWHEFLFTITNNKKNYTFSP